MTGGRPAQEELGQHGSGHVKQKYRAVLHKAAEQFEQGNQIEADVRLDCEQTRHFGDERVLGSRLHDHVVEKGFVFRQIPGVVYQYPAEDTEPMVAFDEIVGVYPAVKHNLQN